MSVEQMLRGFTEDGAKIVSEKNLLVGKEFDEDKRKHPDAYVMNPTAKTRWLAALRTGKYEQGTGSLCENGQWCCLGVLCDALGEEYYTQKDNDYECRVYMLEDRNFTNIIPNDFAGINKDMIGLCWQMNDNMGLSFEQIADVIEEHF